MNYGSRDDIDFVYLGCPHYNIQELRKVAGLLDGKKCKARTWVMTNPQTYKLAEQAGYRKQIEDSGAMLLSGVCAGMLYGVVMPPENKPDVMATWVLSRLSRRTNPGIRLIVYSLE